MGILLNAWDLIEKALPDGLAQLIVLIIFGILIIVSMNRQSVLKGKDTTIETLRQQLELAKERSPEELEKYAKGGIYLVELKVEHLKEELDGSKKELETLNSEIQKLQEQSEVDTQKVDGLQLQKEVLISLIEGRDKELEQLRSDPDQVEMIIKNYGYYLGLAEKAAQFGSAGSGYAMHLIEKEVGSEAARAFTMFAVDLFFPEMKDQPEVQDFLAQEWEEVN